MYLSSVKLAAQACGRPYRSEVITPTRIPDPMALAAYCSDERGGEALWYLSGGVLAINQQLRWRQVFFFEQLVAPNDGSLQL